MSEFLKYSVRFESNQSGTVDRKHVGDPPGYEPTASRDVVRTTAALCTKEDGDYLNFKSFQKQPAPFISRT